MTERWYMATSPYLAGISGAEDRIAAILEQSLDPAQVSNGFRLDTLLSQVVLEAAQKTTAASLLSVYGDTYHLQREVIEDAHALTAVIDACGKAGFGDIATTVCLRSSHYVERAWEIARQHRGRVIEAVRTARPVEGCRGMYEITNATLASDVSDILARDVPHAAPVLVYAKGGDTCRISVRCPPGTTADLGPLVHTLAESCGGNGGGHLLRAGATIPCDKVSLFAKGWQEAVAS
jgi:single-stranded-DNA-specific exonuclease